MHPLSQFLIVSILTLPVVTTMAADRSPEKASSSYWQNPLIKEYGKVRDYPGAASRPDSATHYRILVDVTEGSKTPGKPGKGLEHVARFANLYAMAGVPESRRNIVAVVHGEATSGVLSNKHYQQKFGGDNPNLPLLEALHEGGVKILVCSQALAEENLKPEWVDGNAELVLAAATALVEYQSRGYALLPN